MKTIGLTCILLLFAISYSKAHDYNTGIGVRGGFYNGLTIKHFISESSAVEGLFTTRWRGFQVTGLYEMHRQAFDVPRLHWYYGLGGHIGFFNGSHTHDHWGEDGEPYTIIGIDGILGMEYNIEEIPFNVSLDWKPAINLMGHQGFWGDGFAFSVRYIF